MNQDEKDTIELFLKNAELLRSHSLVRNDQLKVKTKISFVKGEGVKVDRHHINEEALESFLVRLRRFNNQKDIIYFPKIVKILLKYEMDQEETSLLCEAKKYFLNQPIFQKLRLEHSGEVFSEKDMFDHYINGMIFHVDKSKLNKLSSIKNDMGYSFDMFLNAVIDKSRAILFTQDYINHRVLKKN